MDEIVWIRPAGYDPAVQPGTILRPDKGCLERRIIIRCLTKTLALRKHYGSACYDREKILAFLCAGRAGGYEGSVGWSNVAKR